jgi:hypothetical protein
MMLKGPPRLPYFESLLNFFRAGLYRKAFGATWLRSCCTPSTRSSRRIGLPRSHPFVMPRSAPF